MTSIPLIKSDFVQVNGQRIAYDIKGEGPAVLLLHGFPQTRAMWRPTAPVLAQTHCVVTADLRGYGESSKPATMPDMSFRAMAQDMKFLMQTLGFERFHVCGHDRGGRAAHRLALDAPEVVQSLTVMDIVPTHHLLDQLSKEVARAYYHWFFLAQPEPFPETMIAHDPDAYFERCLLGFGKARLADFDPEMLAAYRAAWRAPDCIRAICNDYRAAIDVDFVHDANDLNRKVDAPTLVLYGTDGAMARRMDVPATWAARLDDMRHQAIPGGHFFPDQSPTQTAQALVDFLAEVG